MVTKYPRSFKVVPFIEKKLQGKTCAEVHGYQWEVTPIGGVLTAHLLYTVNPLQPELSSRLNKLTIYIAYVKFKIKII
jgi:hypothetical protein